MFLGQSECFGLLMFVCYFPTLDKLSGQGDTDTWAPSCEQDKGKPGSTRSNLCLCVYGQKALRTFLSAFELIKSLMFLLW